MSDWKEFEIKKFVVADSPGVILAMPGCEDACVNIAHSRLFGDKDFKTASSTEELRSLVAAFKEEEQGVNRLHSGPCYCDKPQVRSLFALRSEQCPFEENFETLRGRA